MVAPPPERGGAKVTRAGDLVTGCGAYPTMLAVATTSDVSLD